MNLKDERIKKLWLRGVTDPTAIARKLGLSSTERVIEGMKRLGIEREKDASDVDCKRRA